MQALLALSIPIPERHLLFYTTRCSVYPTIFIQQVLVLLKVLLVVLLYLKFQGRFLFDSIRKPRGAILKLIHVLASNIPARFSKSIFQLASPNQYSSPLLQINIPARFSKSIFQPASPNQYSSPLLQINIPARFSKSIFQPASSNQFSSPLLQINIPARFSKSIFQPGFSKSIFQPAFPNQFSARFSKSIPARFSKSIFQPAFSNQYGRLLALCSVTSLGWSSHLNSTLDPNSVFPPYSFTNRSFFATPTMVRIL